MTYQKRLRDIREARQLNQREFADLIGIDQGQLSRIESGRQDVLTSTLVRIVDALEMSMSAFWRGVKSRSVD